MTLTFAWRVPARDITLRWRSLTHALEIVRRAPLAPVAAIVGPPGPDGAPGAQGPGPDDPGDLILYFLNGST